MSFKVNYWRDDPAAPFAMLMSTVSTYCHPESADWDGLHDLVQHPGKYSAEDDMRRFKQELHELLVEPNKIPRRALSHAADYGDGSPERFLRRLWRELYPDEPVPGGDDEFRGDLVAIMRGERRLLGSTVSEYTDQYSWDPKAPDADFARVVWQRKYPDEQIPVDPDD